MFLGKKIILYLAFILLFFCLPAYAQNETDLKPPTLQINIPTLNLAEWTPQNSSNWVGVYIVAIYKYGVGIIGIVAAVVMMFGGILWLTAGGDSGKVSEAKEWIKASLYGLIIALTSYTMLYIINPDLVSFASLDIDKIKQTATTNESDATISEIALTSSLSGVGKLTNDDALTALNDNITLKSGASLQNVRVSTVNGLNAFQQQFGNPLIITSGTEGDHNNGTLSHAEGFKVDLRTNDNPQLKNYITSKGTPAGTIAGFPAYTMTIGNSNYRFIIESDHIDTRIVPKP